MHQCHMAPSPACLPGSTRQHTLCVRFPGFSQDCLPAGPAVGSKGCMSTGKCRRLYGMALIWKVVSWLVVCLGLVRPKIGTD